MLVLFALAVATSTVRAAPPPEAPGLGLPLSPALTGGNTSPALPSVGEALLLPGRPVVPGETPLLQDPEPSGPSEHVGRSAVLPAAGACALASHMLGGATSELVQRHRALQACAAGTSAVDDAACTVQEDDYALAARLWLEARDAFQRACLLVPAP